MRTRKVRQRGLDQVTIADLEPGGGLAQPIDNGGGNLAADGVGAEDAGVDMQELHVIHPWYKFVTETI